MQYPLFKTQNLSSGAPLAGIMKEFFHCQLADWPELAEAVESLRAVKKKQLRVAADGLIVQFNTLRMRSIGAKIDEASLAQRPCFLCPQNLPLNQLALALIPGLVALCNPMPIFERHFTITGTEHCPQRLADCVVGLLKLAQMLHDEFIVFFNGAAAGASAPDHLHLQACPIGILPAMAKASQQCPESDGPLQAPSVEILRFAGHAWITLTGTDKAALESKLSEATALCGGDALLNVVAQAHGDVIQVLFIPRRKHRPDIFLKEEPEKVLISPASVELCGAIVSAREEDFTKIDSLLLAQVFEEVLWSDKDVEGLARALSR